MSVSRVFLLSTISFVTAISPAMAQETAGATGQDYHSEDAQDIVVTAPYSQNLGDRLTGTTVLSGENLTREIRSTIGETLARQPGVSSTAFGPNASRPVLRGFQGARVRVLSDGIGSIDVSNISVDHAVAINPLTAERIEVLRGPSALLFGSSAIGGVVNVIDSRIPRRVPDEFAHVETISTYGSAANERSASGAIDLPLARKVVLHFDGSYSKSDDLEIGGFVLARPLRQAAAASDDAEIRDLAGLKDRLPNSGARLWEIAGGIAYVDDGGTIGVSVSHYDNLYAVPVRLSLDPDVEAEEVRIDAKQTRADLRAELYPNGAFIDKIRFRAAVADYEHAELEETGEVGTRFFNDGLEARLELVQTERNGWKGASGIQYFSRDFDVIGEEAFLPRSSTQQIGIFILQEWSKGPLTLEGGARYEHSSVRAFASDSIGNPDLDRDYDSLSASFGASYELAEGLRLGFSLAHSERAPSAEELYANGPHAGTQAFEIGNPDFRKETSNGGEISLNATGNGWKLGASVHYSRFRNYIFERQTGQILDDLPVFQIDQAHARYYGLELDGSAKVAQFGGFAINFDTVIDLVRARIRDEGPAPRIPPLRILSGLEAQSDRLTARVEGEWSDSQKRLAPFETATESYFLLNGSVSVKPFADRPNISLLFSANNIFDVTARRHASFLKDYAPLSGRDLRVTARIGF